MDHVSGLNLSFIANIIHYNGLFITIYQAACQPWIIIVNIFIWLSIKLKLPQMTLERGGVGGLLLKNLVYVQGPGGG
jgi:hypothetical protein